MSSQAEQNIKAWTLLLCCALVPGIPYIMLVLNNTNVILPLYFIVFGPLLTVGGALAWSTFWLVSGVVQELHTSCGKGNNANGDIRNKQK